ncbi:hypothetical protein MC885_020709, partial [Smutsia gigantea]
CKEFLNRFYSSLKARGVNFSLHIIEKELTNFCLDVKGKENRLCYSLGATDDAATKILSEVTHPVSVHMPAVKICEKLKKMDSQICELRYGIMESEKKLDLESLDLSKMRVAELKQILYSRGEEFRACAEKTDYVNLIKELAPKWGGCGFSSSVHDSKKLKGVIASPFCSRYPQDDSLFRLKVCSDFATNCLYGRRNWEPPRQSLTKGELLDKIIATPNKAPTVSLHSERPSAADTHSTTCAQPVAKAGRHPSHLRGEEGTAEKRQDSGTHSGRTGGASQSTGTHSAVGTAQTRGPLGGGTHCEAVPFRTSIPRPSIIEMP